MPLFGLSTRRLRPDCEPNGRAPVVARDLDALVDLYVEDIRVGAQATGRVALHKVFNASLRQFTICSHNVTNIAIELGPDASIGMVRSRIEHAVGADWLTIINLYHDRYHRRNRV